MILRLIDEHVDGPGDCLVTRDIAKKGGTPEPLRAPNGVTDGRRPPRRLSDHCLDAAQSTRSSSLGGESSPCKFFTLLSPHENQSIFWKEGE